MGSESKAPAGPTVLWQARIPRELARSIEDDMRVLGLDGQSEAIREALRLLHRHAREIAVAQAYDDFYGGHLAPLSPYVAALYGEDGAAGE